MVKQTKAVTKAKAKVKRKEKKIEEKRFHEELIAQLLTLATSGFGLVAALAWNQAIQAFVTQYITPRIPGSGLISQLIYAILITSLAVFITYQLSKISNHLESKK
ncbi:MAG: DUF5654 family protein [Microgenomates group bacterium]|jgi:sorbitol-specific phosphotransferase system component IIBC